MQTRAQLRGRPRATESAVDGSERVDADVARDVPGGLNTEGNT